MKRKRFRIYGEIWFSTVGMSLAAGLILSITVAFQDSGDYFFQTFGVYSIIAGALVLLTTPFSMYQTYVPMMISMNCRRREVFTGFQVLKVLSPLSVAGASGILLILNNALHPERVTLEKQFFLIAAGFCFLMIFSVAGNLMGVLYTRFGRMVTLIFIIFTSVCGGILGGTWAAGMNRGGGGMIRVIYAGNVPGVKAGMAAAALALVLADAVVCWIFVRKIEVRC